MGISVALKSGISGTLFLSSYYRYFLPLFYDSILDISLTHDHMFILPYLAFYHSPYYFLSWPIFIPITLFHFVKKSKFSKSQESEIQAL